MRGTGLLDDRETAEMMKAFQEPGSKGELVVGSGDGFGAIGSGTQEIVYTARKVEVMRDDGKVLQKIAQHAAVAGEDWFYRFPVRNKRGSTDSIEGPSIKCANSVARLYGNCQIDTVMKDTGRTFIIYARFIDHETGFSYMRPFQQDKFASKMGGTGPEADARRLDIALQIGVSKAIRNVICNALETFTNFGFEEAKKNLVGRIGKDLPRYKEAAKKKLEEMQIDIKRVEAQFGRTFDNWLAPEIARLAAEMKAIDDGMATIDETWPPPAPPAPKRGDFQGDQAAAGDGTDQTTGQPAEAKGTPDKPAGADQQQQPGPAKQEPGPADRQQEQLPAGEQGTGGPAKGDAQAQEPAPAAKSWLINPAIVGMDAKIAELSTLALAADTPADIDAIEKDNADFIAKTGRRKSDINSMLRNRRSILEKAAE